MVRGYPIIGERSGAHIADGADGKDEGMIAGQADGAVAAGAPGVVPAAIAGGDGAATG